MIRALKVFAVAVGIETALGLACCVLLVYLME
ncbi:hypothetical protein SEA_REDWATTLEHOG_177 [Gordonia phage RedWattleHog]|uniref:Uncharacterized protein n=1 Tax=Gordonia phage Stormageddon TaxID=2656541 RepID=A0A649VRV6_9CAUD|nr:hypothetical protein KHQ86_gp122 [Gordonia phage Stormageddon]QGJ95038.1 hypothetical protein SEA_STORMAGEDDON_178 [Gordonia phage Stormageddon]QLF83680.1 hypothetical protein SEA_REDWATTLEHOG_177 [Gordonia phage RedWattleHog]